MAHFVRIEKKGDINMDKDTRIIFFGILLTVIVFLAAVFFRLRH